MTEVTDQLDVDSIVPKGQFVVYEFGLEDHLKFTQRPLSFFGKIELISILGQAVNKAISDGGVSVSELLDDVPTNSEIAEANNFISALAKIAQYAPDFLLDLYAISLGVPRGERDYVKMVMALSEEEGGLSDEQGMQVLETFIDQNWEVLLDFFKSRIVPLFNKASSLAQGSESSKPSKATRQRTQKV